MKNLGILTILLTTVFLAGCSAQPSSTENANDTEPAAEKKSGDTTKSGKITKVGTKFYLEETGGTKSEIDSYAYDLEEYQGQTITVTGQYSGDTLFIGKIGE